MARTRDLAALSAIFVFPLAALLLIKSGQQQPPSGPAPALAPIELAAPEPTPAPTPAPAPAWEPAVTPAPVVRDPAQAMLLHGDALVVATTVESDWATGRLAVTARPGHLIAQKPVSWDRLSNSARSLADAAVIVYDADGSACVATVTAPRLHLERTGEVFPAAFDADGDPYDSYAPPASKQQSRNFKKMMGEVFEGSSDRLLLATQRAQNQRPCLGVWARRADLPAAQVFGRRPASDADLDALVASALPLVRLQPEFAALATAYAEHLAILERHGGGEEPDWDAFVAANLSVTRWDEIGGPRRIVSVELRLPPESCSNQFSGSLALLLEQHPDRLTRLPQPGFHDLQALMDIDRDGVLEAVTTSIYGEQRLEAEGPGAAAVADGFTIEYHGCPC